MTNERRIVWDILEEKIKGFNELRIQSTINNSEYYNSEEDDAESDPNSNPKFANHTSDGKKRNFTDTYTTNGNSPHKLLINWLISEITPVAIPLIEHKVAEDSMGSGETGYRHGRGMQRCACFLDSYGCKPVWHGQEHSTGRQPCSTFYQVEFPSSDWWQYHRFPNQEWDPRYYQSKGSSGPQWSRDEQPLDTSMDGI